MPQTANPYRQVNGQFRTATTTEQADNKLLDLMSATIDQQTGITIIKIACLFSAVLVCCHIVCGSFVLSFAATFIVTATVMLYHIMPGLFQSHKNVVYTATIWKGN